MPETWYVLDDDSAADPSDVAVDENGVLRHKSGRAVAMASHGPRSRSVDADAERAKAKAATAKADPKVVPKLTRDMKSEEPAQTYKTR